MQLWMLRRSKKQKQKLQCDAKLRTYVDHILAVEGKEELLNEYKQQQTGHPEMTNNSERHQNQEFSKVQCEREGEKKCN